MLDFFLKLYYNLYIERGDYPMTEEAIEMFVEEIMRQYHAGNYEEYSNEELREKYRQMLRNNETIERIEQ